MKILVDLYIYIHLPVGKPGDPSHMLMIIPNIHNTENIQPGYMIRKILYFIQQNRSHICAREHLYPHKSRPQKKKTVTQRKMCEHKKDSSLVEVKSIFCVLFSQMSNNTDKHPAHKHTHTHTNY